MQLTYDEDIDVLDLKDIPTKNTLFLKPWYLRSGWIKHYLEIYFFW